MPEAPIVLETRGLQAWYGESHVLHGVDLQVRQGECVTLIGRNGAGRTTTLKAILGLTDRRSGSVRVNGREVINLPPHRVARLGLGYCPEERGIYRTLTTAENLTLLPKLGVEGLPSEEVLQMFPNLRERAQSYGGQLSGGEQQMLAIARILRTGARFLMLDEPTEGLAPVIIQQIGNTIARLKSQGFTILLVEQNFRWASTVADRFYIVEHGKVIDGFASAELPANMDKLHTYLGV